MNQKYVVVEETDRSILEFNVSERLNAGWCIAGPLVVVYRPDYFPAFAYFQPMVGSL